MGVCQWAFQPPSPLAPPLESPGPPGALPVSGLFRPLDSANAVPVLHDLLRVPSCRLIEGDERLARANFGADCFADCWADQRYGRRANFIADFHTRDFGSHSWANAPGSMPIRE